MKWIPCSERLPEEEGSYLVTDDAGGMKTVYEDDLFACDDGVLRWGCSQNVIAWMQLPDPYRSE